MPTYWATIAQNFSSLWQTWNHHFDVNSTFVSYTRCTVFLFWSQNRYACSMVGGSYRSEDLYSVRNSLWLSLLHHHLCFLWLNLSHVIEYHNLEGKQRFCRCASHFECFINVLLFIVDQLPWWLLQQYILVLMLAMTAGRKRRSSRKISLSWTWSTFRKKSDTQEEVEEPIMVMAKAVQKVKHMLCMSWPFVWLD